MSIFPTDRPLAPARQRDGVPDRPTLSATGHASRPDSGDPTDRLSRAVSPPPGWVGAADLPTLSEAARGREYHFQLRVACVPSTRFSPPGPLFVFTYFRAMHAVSIEEARFGGVHGRGHGCFRRCARRRPPNLRPFISRAGLVRARWHAFCSCFRLSRVRASSCTLVTCLVRRG